MLSYIRSFLFENTSIKQTIIKNTFWLLLGELINKGSIFIITVLIAHILGPEQFGVMSFITSFTGMFIILTDFGLTTLMVREVSCNKDKLSEYLINFSLLKVFLGLITFLITFFASQFIEESDHFVTLILIYCSYAILNNIAEFLRAAFRPSEQMQHEAYMKIINGIIFIGIVGFLLFTYGTILAILYGFLGSAIIGLGVSSIYVFRRFNFSNVSIRKSSLKLALKKGAYIGLGSFFIALYVSSDQMIMGFYGLYKDLGLYSLAYKFSLLLSVFTSMIFMALLPRTSAPDYIENIENNYKRGLKIIFKYNIILILLIESMILFIGRFNLGTYQVSLYILQILLISNIIEPLGYWGYINLISLDKENYIFFIVIIVGTLNIILNIIFIPIYSYYGAIFNTIISYYLYFLLINIQLLGGKYSNIKENI